MKRTILSLIFSVFIFSGYSQFLGMANNSFVPGDFYTSFYRTNSPLNTIGNRMDIINWRDSCRDAHWFSTKIRLFNIAQQTAGSVPGNIVWLDASDSGRVKVSNTFASSVITNSLGYTPSTSSRNLTINGITYDLSADRTWTVGDVTTATLSSVLAGYPTNSSLATTLSGYATTGALTSGLAGKQNTIATGTTAQYLRGDGSLATFPTNLSSFTNGPGYITSYTETDPLFDTKFAAKTTTGLIEGTNLYFTNTRARSAISLTTTGSSGAATYNSTTGVLNVPNYTSSARSYNNTPGRSIVSVAAAANGFQISSTRDAQVQYAVTISTTVSLSGSAVGYVVFEICPTNSATAGDWMEIDRVPSGQSGALVVGLTLNQTGGGHVGGGVPAGYYSRVRSVNTTGTPTYAMNSGQETLL